MPYPDLMTASDVKRKEADVTMLVDGGLFPHVPWVQPSILEADVFIAVCGCGWRSEPRDSETHAKLSAHAHLDDVKAWVAEQEAALGEPVS